MGVRHAPRLSFCIQGSTDTLFEKRAPWSGSHHPAWTRTPVAPFRYQGHRRPWTLGSRDGNQRWHRLSGAGLVQHIGDLIAALDADVTGIFRG